MLVKGGSGLPPEIDSQEVPLSSTKAGKRHSQVLSPIRSPGAKHTSAHAQLSTAAAVA